MAADNHEFYTPFRYDEVFPEGWVKRQLRIQAEGLAGNLDNMWPDVKDSAWIGGDKEGWERVPYWLDGFVPLAFLLRDEKMISRAKNTWTRSWTGRSRTAGSVRAKRANGTNTTSGRCF